MEGLLTVKEAAAILRWHPKYVYKLASNGTIPSERVGKRSVRFRETVIQGLLRAREDTREGEGGNS